MASQQGSGKGMKKASYKAPPSSTSVGGGGGNATNIPSNRNKPVTVPKRTGKKLIYPKQKNNY
jgi:hypothetical protein